MTCASRLLSALFATSAVGAAHAADPNANVRLEVRAPSNCTSQADLMARILARLQRARFVDDQAALGVRAQFTTLSSGNVATDLTLTKAGAKPSSRRLVTQSCAQAADAVALIVAVTLDPTSIRQAAATRAETAAPGEDSSGAPQGSTLEAQDKTTTDAASNTTADGKEQQRNGPARVELPRDAGEEARPASPGAANQAWSPRLSLQVSAEMFGGVAPTLMPGLGVHVLAGLDRETLWSPAVMLGASHGFDVSAEATGGIAAFWLDAASLDTCALRIHVRSFETRACASALVGRLSANATDTSNAAGTVRRPFLSMGAAALMALRLEPTLELTARAALSANVIRDSFEFAPLVFHTVPSLTFAASVGIGIRSR
jgi:hypothetical protein